MPIYLKADGAKGNVSAQGYENWVDVSHFQFTGITHPIQQRTGNMWDRVQGSAQFGLIHLQRIPDNSTSFWFQYAHSTHVIPNLEIHWVTAGNPPQTFQKIKLTNAFVSYFYQEHSVNRAAPLESVSLGYDSIEVSYTPRDADNTPGNPLISGFNVSSGTKM